MVLYKQAYRINAQCVSVFTLGKIVMGCVCVSVSERERHLLLIILFWGQKCNAIRPLSEIDGAWQTRNIAARFIELLAWSEWSRRLKDSIIL